jgi:hypothetical protein
VGYVVGVVDVDVAFPAGCVAPPPEDAVGWVGSIVLTITVGEETVTWMRPDRNVASVSFELVSTYLY